MPSLLPAAATDTIMEVNIIGTTISFKARTHNVPGKRTSFTAASDALQAANARPMAKPMTQPSIVSDVMRRITNEEAARMTMERGTVAGSRSSGTRELCRRTR